MSAGERSFESILATLDAYLARSGAARVAVVLDLGEEAPPVMVECEPGEEARVSAGEEGYLYARETWSDAEPGDLPDMRRLDPLDVRVEDDGEARLPTVQLAYLATHVRSLAELLPGRSVATAEFATVDPDLVLVIAAREGDPLVVMVGEHTYEMAPGWP